VLYSALVVGKSDFDKYIILGDDVCIADQEVALIYKDVMTQIGIEISAIKTVISNDKFVSAEFASK